MKKNWKRISEIGNEQLRTLMVSAQGEIADGLAIGFPQYFLTEDEQQELPTKDQLLRLMKGAGRRDEILEILHRFGIPQQHFSFSGCCRGSVDCVSVNEEGYYTARYGWLANYRRSSKRQGEDVEYEGARWLVVWNSYAPGTPKHPSRHSLVIVPAEAIAP